MVLENEKMNFEALDKAVTNLVITIGARRLRLRLRLMQRVDVSAKTVSALGFDE